MSERFNRKPISGSQQKANTTKNNERESLSEENTEEQETIVAMMRLEVDDKTAPFYLMTCS